MVLQKWSTKGYTTRKNSQVFGNVKGQERHNPNGRWQTGH